MRILLIISVIALTGISAYLHFGDYKDKEVAIVGTVLQFQNHLHYMKVPINDDFSKETFDNFIESLDYQKRFFIQDEIDQLNEYRNDIDNESLDGNTVFFDLAITLINNAIKRSNKLYHELLSKPFDFDVDEKVQMDADKKTYAKDPEALKESWRKLLKYETLTKLSASLEQQEKTYKDSSESARTNMKTFDELEEKARKDVLKMYDRWFDRMDEIRRADQFGNYVNSMMQVFDPHSNYFSPKEKEDFDFSMSGRLEGIGARLQTDGDYTKVVDIIPGGPAWKQKELEVNDLITKVTQFGKEPVDVTGMRIDDVVKMIRGKKGTKVILTVKKENGELKDIMIVRDEVIWDEGFAKSLILESKDHLKLGYIKLPKFYSNFNGGNSPKCSEDIRKELEKLKNAEVQGVILDLRFNGGGSLQEVVDMSGLFIEQGPIVQVKGRSKKPMVYNDQDPTVAYDGPLIIMVNSFSASASEILAAALQDYKRAIIVGSESTFGKGTVQRFFDLDRAVKDRSIKPLGQVKLTTQKYYRINGGSVQLKGVIPDIILPDKFQYVDTGEKEYDHALQWDEIEALNYSQNVNNMHSNIDRIKANSLARIDTNKTFQKIIAYAGQYKKLRDETEYSLNIDTYRVRTNERNEQSKQFKNMFHKIEGLTIMNPPEDTAYIHADSSRIARNDAWMKNVSKDVYIDESISILQDCVNQ